MKITESTMIYEMHKWIRECDADDMATLAEHMFGGKIFYVGDENYQCVFELEPDENYMGAFGEIPEEKDCPILEPSDQ